MYLSQETKHYAETKGNYQLALVSVLMVAFAFAAVLPALAATGQHVAHNTPLYVSTAKNLGPEVTSKQIEIDVWLNPHNRAEMDELGRQLYDRNSSSFRHFLKSTEVGARFAPTLEEAKTVQAFLEGHNLKTVRIGPNNFFVRARGTVGEMESAFHVTLNRYQVLGKVLRANDRDPSIEGPAAALVSSIAGLDSGEYEHPLMSRSILSGQKPGVSAQVTKPASVSLFSSDCFNGTEKETFSNNNNGSQPIATYTGNHLNLQSNTSNGCAYTPPVIHTAYNLTGLYKEGFNGAGQTIGIIDWCGSLTIQSDANAFSEAFGLPALTSSNFAITYIPTVSTCQADDQVEINLDVEWSHAVAPGANINLIVPPSASFADVDEATYTAVTYGLATVISGSYGAIELLTPESVISTENLISEIAAIQGISTNFATGDTGDFTADGLPATVLVPAASPYATAVGGVTLALNSDNAIAWQAGWGNNETLLAEEGFIPDPIQSDAFGFIGGSGGGPSNCATKTVNSTTGAITCIAGFPKPSFQKALPGKYRQLPDVSWLADPYTGAAIVITVPGSIPAQQYQVWGGTSLATPMFSGLWAIAQQEAGGLLGQAAPYLYSLPSGAIYDITPVSSPTNVHGKITDSSGTTAYNANQVMGGGSPGRFVSAIWDYPFVETTALAISFGMDCTAGPTFGVITACTSSSSLHTNPGWDNVTGVGTPNAKAFADSFKPAP